MKTILKERYRRPSHPEGSPSIHPVFDDFHRLRVLEDSEYPCHGHANYEWILVEKGPYRCRLNEAELELRAGQVLVVKPGDTHQDHFRKGQRHYVLHFRIQGSTPGNAPQLFREGCLAHLQVCEGNHRGEATLLGELRKESEQGAPHAPRVQDVLLEALFWRTVRDLPAAGLSPFMRRLPQQEALRLRVLTIMEKHLDGPASMEALAREIGISIRSFTSLCQRIFGTTPARLFLLLRLRKAEAELLKRQRSIKEVSDRLGFANPYHFSRAFRRHMGHPPSEV